MKNHDPCTKTRLTTNQEPRPAPGLRLVAGLWLLGTVATAQTAGQPENAAVELAFPEITAQGVTLHPLVSDPLDLSVSLPNGEVRSLVVEPGNAPSFTVGPGFPDGLYSWELRELAAATEGRSIEELIAGTPVPTSTRVQSGAFRVQQGSILRPREFGPESYEPVGGYDELVTGNLYVDGSLCVGFDCVNNEPFGFDTIRLKENNLRIHFEDTSTIAEYPRNDWRITVNDSVNGGRNRFSIDDASASRTPLTIEAGARANALWLDDTGRVGFGTSTPAKELHVVSGDTPGLRLDQDGSGGWPPQAWEVMGNEVGFLLRDVTHGGRLPLRVEAGAPSHSLVIDERGWLGVGTVAPEVPFDFRTTGTNAVMKLCRTDGGATGILSSGEKVFSLGSLNGHPLQLLSGGDWKLKLFADGRLAMKSGASVSAGGAWATSCDGNEQLNVRSLTHGDAVSALVALEPVLFNPKASPGEEHVGFSTSSSSGMLMHGDEMCAMDVAAVLTRVVQQQQKVILRQKEELELITRRLDAVERLAARSARARL